MAGRLRTTGQFTGARPAMRLSVIIPAFNEEKYISQCIACIYQALQANQARINSYEIIVTDNNSTDNTAKRAREAGAQVVFEPINQISRARNTGARQARGDWLLFVDADTQVPESTLSNMVDHILTDRYVGGGCDGVVDRAPLIGRVIVFAARKIMKLTNCAAGSFLFCRADAFRETGGFSEEIYAGEEIVMSNALKHWAKPGGLKFVFLTRTPVVTSGRKFYLYSYWDFAKVMLFGICSWKRTFSSRDRLGYFYDGKR